jgi:protein TonB
MAASSSRPSPSRPPPSSQRAALARVSTRPPPPLGVVVSAHEPMDRVLDLAKGQSVSKGVVASTVIQALFLLVMALLADWGLANWTRQIQAEIQNQLRSDYEIEITKDDTPPPPPPPEEEPKPEAKPVVEVKPLPANAPPPPPAAAAAPIVTAPADPNQIEDMTNTIVTGNGPGSGGVTMNEGSQGVGRGPGVPSPASSPAGTSKVAAPPPVPTVDHSKTASAMNGDWRCPFPPAADIAGIDDANAVVEVVVRPDGTPASARIIRDPGNGFGPAAVSCAMRERFHAALDRDGNPIQQSKQFNVKFSR